MPIAPSRRLALAAVSVLAALPLVSGCATGARPSTAPTGPRVTATSKVPPAAPSAATGAGAAKTPAAAPTNLAPTGDAAIDQMDGDLAAFEKESAGLDNAAAATQEPKK
jgi:hypothetical protein